MHYSTDRRQLELRASEEAVRAATRMHALQVALHDAHRHNRSLELSSMAADPAPLTPALSTSRGSMHTSTPQRPGDVQRSIADQTAQLRLAAQALHRDMVEPVAALDSQSSAGLSLNDSSFHLFASQFQDVSRDIQALEEQAAADTA